MSKTTPSRTVTLPLSARTDEQKYKVADAITRSCANIPAEVVEKHKAYYFRQIINSPVRVQGQVVPVSQAFIEDDAIHITNLVLSRLSAPTLFRTPNAVAIEE